MLVAVKGKEVNEALLHIAVDKRPSLIIDCANAADPFNMKADEEALNEIFVVNAEAIYRFRSVLAKARHMLIKLKLKVLVVTSIRTLFSYDDPIEDFDVINGCYQILKSLSRDFEVFVCLDNYSEKVADEIWDIQ